METTGRFHAVVKYTIVYRPAWHLYALLLHILSIKTLSKAFTCLDRAVCNTRNKIAVSRCGSRSTIICLDLASMVIAVIDYGE